MGDAVIWWFGLVSLAVFAPIGFFIALSVALDHACRNYPALWRALCDAAIARAKRERAKREQMERESDA